MNVGSNGMVDAVSHITTSFVRLDMKLGPYIGVHIQLVVLTIPLVSQVGIQMNRECPGEISALAQDHTENPTTIHE